MCSESIDIDKRASLNEKREKIKELRLKRERCEERLYLSQMELVRFENILLKRSRGEIKFGDKKVQLAA